MEKVEEKPSEVCDDDLKAVDAVEEQNPIEEDERADEPRAKDKEEVSEDDVEKPMWKPKAMPKAMKAKLTRLPFETKAKPKRPTELPMETKAKALPYSGMVKATPLKVNLKGPSERPPPTAAPAATPRPSKFQSPTRGPRERRDALDL